MKPAVAVILALALGVLARTAWATDLTDPVPGRPGLRYADLVKLVTPGLARKGDDFVAQTVVPFEHIEGRDSKAPPDLPITFGLDPVEAMPVPGRPDRLILLIDLGSSEGNVEEAEVLALFALEPKPRLLDVVGVGNDHETAIGSDAPLMLAPGAPLILVDSGHTNSDQSFNTTELIFLRQDRFRLIDTQLSFGDQACGYQRVQTQSYRLASDTGPYKALTMTVRETVKHTGDQCEGDPKPPKAGVRTFAATYHWNPTRSRFETTSKALSILEAEDEKRF